MRKICFFNRSSIHYRKNIWMLMDQELPCDFYFGDSRPGRIEDLDTSFLSNFKGKFHNVTIGPFYWQSGALKLLRSEYTDIITPGDIHCISTWLFLLLSKVTKKRIYFWTHGAYGDESFFRRWLTRFRYKFLAGAFLYGNYAKEFLVKYGIPENKLHVIYNSLDYDNQLPMRSILRPTDIYRSHFDNDDKNIVFIGRLTTVKKLDQILKAVAKLKKKGRNLNVTFVGDGSERQQLEALSKELDLNNVWFYGACYDEYKIAELLYNADVCVSPGNVGLTAMHAMSFGCPIISHNNFAKQMPEFEAIEKGRTGTFFKENDVDDLSEVINKWINTCSDRESVRQACYKVIDEKYNPHIQLKTLQNVLYNK